VTPPLSDQPNAGLVVGQHARIADDSDAFEYGGSAPHGGHILALYDGEADVRFYGPTEDGSWVWVTLTFPLSDLNDPNGCGPPAPGQPMTETPQGYMEAAYDALHHAAAAFQSAGDNGRARSIRWLAEHVMAEDPELADRVWRMLPGPGEPGVRSDPIARALNVPDARAYAALEGLRGRLEARQAGGWWTRRGNALPSTARTVPT